MHHSGHFSKPDDSEVSQLFSNTLKSGLNFDRYENIPVEVSPQDACTQPIHSFEELGLDRSLVGNVGRCKYIQPTPVQKFALPILMHGRDLMSCAQTGSGKTAAFLLPSINGILKNYDHRGRGRSRGAAPSSLVLSPTRELATQIYDEARKFVYGLPLFCAVLYGGCGYKSQFDQLNAGPEIVVATPGRLMDMIERNGVALTNVRSAAVMFVLETMGFEKDIRTILTKCGLPRQRQTMMFSATFPKGIQQLAAEFLQSYIFLTVGRVGSTTDLIRQRLEWIEEKDKRATLLGMLLHPSAKSVLVFVNHKQEAQSLGHWLTRHGLSANSIHGDRSQEERENALKGFKTGVTPVLVATDVAARGLDIPNVSHVIQYDMALGIDDYVHRIGRTGRAGNTGNAISFMNDRSKGIACELVELLRESNQSIPIWLQGMVAQQGAYSALVKKSGATFGGQDFRTDKSFERTTQKAQTFDSFDADAYRGFTFNLNPSSPPSTDAQGNARAGGFVAALLFKHPNPPPKKYCEKISDFWF